MKRFLIFQLLLIAVLLLPACATTIEKSLENETGEIWNCQGGVFLDKFYAVYDEASGSGYVLYQSIGYKSNFQKVKGKPEKIFAESVTTGFEELNWQFPRGRLRIWNDGSEPGFAGTFVIYLKDGSHPIDMRCTKE